MIRCSQLILVMIIIQAEGLSARRLQRPGQRRNCLYLRHGDIIHESENIPCTCICFCLCLYLRHGDIIHERVSIPCTCICFCLCLYLQHNDIIHERRVYLSCVFVSILLLVYVCICEKFMRVYLSLVFVFAYICICDTVSSFISVFHQSVSSYIY